MLFRILLFNNSDPDPVVGTEIILAQQTGLDSLKIELAKAIAERDLAQATTFEAQRQTELLNQKAKRSEVLLAEAQKILAAKEATNFEAQRQTELLNQQVSALREQLGQLQILLDDATERDETREVQLQSLGSDLNTALARVAAEERRRRELEEAQRLRNVDPNK